MSFNVYLTFDGKCREAFDFYRSVLGGEFSAFMTFGDGPPDMGVPEAEKGPDHARLPAHRIRGADGQRLLFCLRTAAGDRHQHRDRPDR